MAREAELGARFLSVAADATRRFPQSKRASALMREVIASGVRKLTDEGLDEDDQALARAEANLIALGKEATSNARSRDSDRIEEQDLLQARRLCKFWPWC